MGVDTKKDYEDPRLLPCALCGGKAYYKRTVLWRGCNSTGEAPEGAEIVEVKEPLSGNPPKLYRWEKYGYAVHCLTPKCGCRTARNGYKTLDEAVEAWNGNRRK